MIVVCTSDVYADHTKVLTYQVSCSTSLQGEEQAPCKGVFPQIGEGGKCMCSLPCRNHILVVFSCPN